MARILITTWGSHGDVDPFLALAHALRARGHHPVIASSAYWRPIVEREGIAFRRAAPDVHPDDRHWVARVMDPARGTEFLLRDVLVPALDRWHDETDDAAADADLVVTHPVTFAAPMVAERRRLPWVSTVLAPMSFFSPTDLPVFAPAPWMKGLERAGPWMGRALVRTVKRVSAKWTRPVDALRARLGLPPVADPLFEGQHSPHRVLALFSRALAEPQPDWPRHVVVTGQLVHDAAHGTALAPELERFLAAGPPPVVFTLGTSAVLVGERFYNESAAAARRLGRRAVLLVGPTHVAAMQRVAGPDVLVVASAPHSLLFPRAAVVVQQCGVGTLGQVLRAGRPTLCVPWSHDQPDNAHRAHRLGMARVLYPRRYRAAHAARELDALLGDPSYAAAAVRVADRVRAENGPRAAADAIEAVLAG